MLTSSVSGSPASAEAAEAQRAATVLKKTQDVEKQTAESLVQLVKQAPPAAPGRIDAYA